MSFGRGSAIMAPKNDFGDMDTGGGSFVAENTLAAKGGLTYGRGGSILSFGVPRPIGGGTDAKNDGFSNLNENKNASIYSHGGSDFPGGGFLPCRDSNKCHNDNKNGFSSGENEIFFLSHGEDVLYRDKKNIGNEFSENNSFDRNCQGNNGYRVNRGKGVSGFNRGRSTFGCNDNCSNYGLSSPNGDDCDNKDGGFSRRDENKNENFRTRSSSGFSSRNDSGGFGNSFGIQDHDGNRDNRFFFRNDNNFSRSNRSFPHSDKKNTEGFCHNNFVDSSKRSNNENANDFVYTGPSHVPKVRAIDDIFQEDTNSAENYLQIRAEDDNVVVTPNLDTVAVIDHWDEADLEPSLVANIYRANYRMPRKIQSYAIPIILEGIDVKGHAETGSGKTAAFLIPIIDMIIKKKTSGMFTSRRSHPYALIIEPTRELAIQLYDQAQKLTHETGVSVAVTYGKYRTSDNLREISLGCDILVGTPGRLRDFVTKGYVIMTNLQVLVLDEADRLLEDVFMVEIRSISSAANFPEKNNRQTLLFSATFTPDVQKWADEILRERNVMVSNQKFVSANCKIVQNFMLVCAEDKKDQLIKLLKGELEEKQRELPDGQTPRLRRTLIFVQKRRDADVLSTYLCQDNIKATTINGDRTQKMREESLEKFRNDEVDVVVSTDVCARGIDIKDLDHVINFDLPLENYVTYIHRIGRTGRLKQGMATSFYDPSTDSMLAKDLVAGVRETGQVPPDFLVMAAENRLNPPRSNEDDRAWGIYSTSATDFMLNRNNGW